MVSRLTQQGWHVRASSAGRFRIEDLAQTYAIVGENDRAVGCLEILVRIAPFRYTWPIRGDPTCMDLRGDPRFQALGS